jgi:transcriptional regulator with XRE-family HTH domain
MATHKGGYLVKHLRNIKGQSQADLAKQVGIGQSHLSEIENGQKTNPSAKVLKKLADALGFTMDEWFTGKKV